MAEVAGLILGVVPIILEALKQYKACYQICRRFRKCKNGIEELLDCLHTQKVIFANETRLLLADVLGPEDARAMVSDTQHPRWQDTTTISRINDYLGESKEAIARCGQDVSSRMKAFKNELDDLQLPGAQARPAPDKAWRKEIRNRFKFAFSESKLESTARGIVECTKTYRTLRSQLREMTSFERTPAHDSRSTRTCSLERVAMTQAAAKRVYQVLAAACKLHTKHHAQFSLRPEYTSSAGGTDIRFQIAYRHLSRHQARGSQDILWFMVESIVDGRVSTLPPAMPAPGAVQGSKRSASPSLMSVQATLHTQAKRVRFAPPAGGASMSCTPCPTAQTSVPSMSELGTSTNFCTQLRACCKKAHATGRCIGWLEDSSPWRHRVLESSGPRCQDAEKGAETLSMWLTSARKTSSAHCGLPLLQRLQLAKLLTTATLNFHATPWMQSCWSSQEIFLYDFGYHTNKPGMQEPDAFIEVPVDVQVNTTALQSPNALAPYVRNPILFNLAVMLLELAFEKPLQDMITVADRKAGLPAVMTDYHAALRLSGEVSTHLGPRYSNMVEKCLFCAFGQGTELSDPALQSAIHTDVVSELDRLAVGFQNLIIV